MDNKSNLARLVTIGKHNPNNCPERDFVDHNGKPVVYRFYYKGNDWKLCRVIELINKYRDSGLTADEYMELVSYVWIVQHKNTKTRKSKLNGIKSISTSCLDNPFCIARMQDSNSICHYCYAGTQQERQHGLQEHNVINGLILRNVAIPAEYWKALAIGNDRFIRIESFGDVANETQVENYISIMQAFPSTVFVAWTKNVFTWTRVFDRAGKPDNMVFIVSSCYVNLAMILPESVLSYVDHVFTVYDDSTIAEKGIKINCGGRSCMDCIRQGKRCYFRGTDFHIMEQKK